jgi:hypothetical protein
MAFLLELILECTPSWVQADYRILYDNLVGRFNANWRHWLPACAGRSRERDLRADSL